MVYRNHPSRGSTHFGIDHPPLVAQELASRKSSLRSRYLTYLNGVLALAVLAIGVSVRALSLGFDSDRELLQISFYTGGWIGLFSGLSIKGNHLARLQMIFIGIVVCCSASLASSMLVTLLVGYAVAWISSINILASALGSMWLLTYYDGVIKELNMMKTVSATQLEYMVKAANGFEALMQYAKRIRLQGRKPVMGEYWVVREWIRNKANAS